MMASPFHILRKKQLTIAFFYAMMKSDQTILFKKEKKSWN